MSHRYNQLAWVPQAGLTYAAAPMQHRIQSAPFDCEAGNETLSGAQPVRLFARRIAKQGSLSEFAASLWSEGVQIQDFSGAVNGGIIEISMIVDKPELAQEILMKRGWHFTDELTMLRTSEELTAAQ